MRRRTAPAAPDRWDRLRPARALLAALLLAAGALGAALGPRVAAQADRAGPVYVVPITGEIDLGLAPYLERVLAEAEDAGAALVVLEIDTPGGRLDAALRMRDALIGSPVPTLAYVDRDAFSAGALIAIAAERIWLAPGAVLGAATPVDGTGETASAKVVSAVRKTFKSTAETRGRDPRVAEAMVDPDVAVEGLDARGELLTLTVAEAQTWGYADGVAPNRAALLEALGLAGREVVETSPGLAERTVRFVTNPVVASLLILGALLLIVGDLLVGGVGLIGLAGLGLLALFFWGHALAGLAGWEDVLLVGLGLVLIGVEIFVVPGFGVAGVLGVGALLGGLVLAMLGRDFRTSGQVRDAGLAVGAAFVLAVAGTGALLWLLYRATGGPGRLGRLGGLVLSADVAGGTAAPAETPPVGRRRGPGARVMRWLGGGDALVLPAERPEAVGRTDPGPSLVGARGVALSDLRPGGVADLAGRRVDVVTEGGHVAAGQAVEVVADERYRRVVRPVEP